MDASTDAEPLNKDGFAAFAARAGDGMPVVMLNLLAFEPDGGRERYEEYGEAVAPLIGSPGYQEIGHLRTEALVRGELHPLDPAPNDG